MIKCGKVAIMVVVSTAFLFTSTLHSNISADTLRLEVGQGDDTLGRMEKLLKTRTYAYPAGGFDVRVRNPNNNYYNTSQGAVSVGLSMQHRLLYPDVADYPTVIIAPNGDWTGKDGTNLMQIYFAIACNFFFHKRNGVDNPKTTIVCRADQKDRIIEYLKLGNPYYLPNKANYPEELIKRFEREAIYLADRAVIDGQMQMAAPYPDMVTFETFDENLNEASIGDVVITDKRNGTFAVNDKGEAEGILDGRNLTELELELVGVEPLSDIPELGVTFLGTSSGMDANGLSSSQIVWAGDHQVLVDLGIATVGGLRALGLAPSDISHIAITHMHEDHVAGALQYFHWCKSIGHPIRLIIEPGIYELFKEQAKQILNNDLESVYDVELVPIKFYAAIELGKGSEKVTIEAIPGFHGTPVMMNRYTYKGKTISHSSDTTFDPIRFDKILENDMPDNIRKDLSRELGVDKNVRVFNKARADELAGVLFGSNATGNMPSIVIYEGGNAAALGENASNHTTPFAFQTLTEYEQRTIWVNHAAKLPGDQEFLVKHAAPISTLAVDLRELTVQDVNVMLSNTKELQRSL